MKVSDSCATDHSGGYLIGSPVPSFFLFSLILSNQGYLKGAIYTTEQMLSAVVLNGYDHDKSGQYI